MRGNHVRITAGHAMKYLRLKVPRWHYSNAFFLNVFFEPCSRRSLELMSLNSLDSYLSFRLPGLKNAIEPCQSTLAWPARTIAPRSSSRRNFNAYKRSRAYAATQHT